MQLRVINHNGEGQELAIRYQYYLLIAKYAPAAIIMLPAPRFNR